MENSSSAWFKSDVEYYGTCCAEFTDPKIILEGSAKIQFTELGQPNIEMKFDKIKCGADPKILELLNRNVNTTEYSQILKFINRIDNNKCIKLSVTSPEGTFSSIGSIILHYIPNHLESVIKFALLTSQFKTTKKEEAKYWIIPLFNFIMKSDRNQLKKPHPLSNIDANMRIVFKQNTNECFIEPLRDYESREEDLINLKKPKRLTALMIGELGSEEIDPDLIDKWAPLNFLYILGLATGIQVGAPWIELRTEGGFLVQRIHSDIGNPVYAKGFTTIDGFWNSGISQLLTDSQYKNFGEQYTNVIIEHIIRAGNQNLTGDEKLTHIFQALDCLASTYNLSIKDLNESLEELQRQNVARTLEAAKNQILSLRSPKGNRKSDVTLGQIANKVFSSDKKIDKFGVSLASLLRLFSLPDAEIINKHYSAKFLHNSDWCGFINQWRNEVIHEGYLDYKKVESNPQELTTIINHMQDILIRIIFTMLCYNGAYHSPINYKDNYQDNQIDWVKINTSHNRLGYK
jgi:hypothetical protein